MSKFDWGDGHGKVHSRPKKHGGGKPHKPKPTGLEYLNAPQTTTQIGAQADQMAGLQYGGQEQQLGQRQQSVAPWFQNYMSTIQGAQTQNQQLVQPMVDQARTAATNSGQTVLAQQGVDPNSEAAQNDVLAAAGRKALGDAAATQLASILGAGQTFLGNQQAIAPMYQQQASQHIGQEQSQLQAEKGAYRASTYGDLLGKERQYGLDIAHQNVENQAFGLDKYQAETDRKQIGATAKAKANEVVTSGPFAGLTKKQIRNLSPAQKTKLRNKGKGPKGPTALQLAQYDVNKDGKLSPGEYVNRPDKGGGGKDGLTPAQRRAARKERGKAVQRIQDIKGEFNRYKGQRSKDANGKTIKPTRAQVISQLRKDGYTPAEINLGLKLRSNRPLNKNDIATAKRLGIWPIPKGWTRKTTPKPTGGAVNQGAAGYPYGEGAGQVH